MSFQIGDKVSFLNEALDGVISKIIDHKLVEVTTSDGFDIPVLAAELVKIGGESKKQSNPIPSINISDTSSTHQPIRSSIDVKPYLCFSRNSEKSNELYILNNTPYVSFFALRIQKAGEWILIYSGKVSKHSYIFVGNYNDKELESFRNVSIEITNIEFSLKTVSYTHLTLPTTPYV